MKIKNLLIAFLTIISFTLNAQSNEKELKYQLYIGDNPIIYKPNFDDNIQPNKIIFDNQFFKIVQFYEHPTNVEKELLKNNGIELINYLPNYAWLVSFNKNADIMMLKNHNVRFIIDVPTTYKLSKELHSKKYPSHAIKEDNIDLVVTCFKTINATTINEELIRLNIKAIDSEKSANIKIITLPINEIENFANLPFVQYIEPIAPPPSFDGGFVEDRSNERANYLASEQINGLHYDGTDITLAVVEGGTVDVAVHNDFKGRLDVTLDGSQAASDHKTPVSQRIAGYGNDNPLYTGMAYGANLISAQGNFQSLFNNGAIAINNSYGYGCNTSNYGSNGNSNDDLVYNNPTKMIIYSAGNIQTTDCGYGAGAGWGTITGDVKQAKNVIAVGAINNNDEMTSFSSWGPAPDGRIKPDICAVGPGGTSFACPNVVGSFGQLYHAYSDIHNTMPNSGLIKAILQNTADDLGNAGPDFKYGYGRINLRRAYNTIANSTFLTNTITNGTTNTHNITVPVGTKQIRAILYWTDYEGTIGSSIALINNLNFTITTPSSITYNPWILDHTINAVNLNTPAIRGVDNLNNMEQVTIDNPTAGVYTFTVDGFSVPQGPQTYFIVYEFLQEELTITYPIGGESMVEGEIQRIYWDNYGNTTNTFNLFYSTDNGNSWTSIASNLPNNTRYYDWSVPSVTTGQAKIKITSGSLSSQSSESFSIIDVPENLNVVWSCADSLMLNWSAVSNATGYEVYKLGTKYMTSIGTTTNTYYVVNNVSTTNTEYFAVRAIGTNNAKGRRTLSIEKTVGDVNCIAFESKANAITSHVTGYYPSCYNGFENSIHFQFANIGVAPITTLSISYQINGGAIQTETFNGNVPSGSLGTHIFSTSLSPFTAGTYTIVAWTNNIDVNINNDTTRSTIIIYNASSNNYPYTQTFDAFTTCNIGWGCDISCTLSQDWYNLPNASANSDDADWRTISGATPSGSTGADYDHTSGTGKYLYLEGTSSGGSGCDNQVAYLLSPCIDLSNASYPYLSFWYHAYGGSIGELHVDVLVDGVWNEDYLTPIIGQQGNMWKEKTGYLTDFIGKTVVIRFRGYFGSGFTADISLDDISVKERPPYELQATKIVNPVTDYYPSCYTEFNAISINIKNMGSSTITNPTLKYQFNGGTIVSEVFNVSIAPDEDTIYTFTTALNTGALAVGSYNIVVWLEHLSDNDNTNNSLTNTLSIYNGSSATFPYTQTFDAFTTCSDATPCNTTNCNLSEGWYNFPSDINTSDIADWRTYSGKTPTGYGYATGPNGDHTSGTGKYLYAETSSGTGCQNSPLLAYSPCIDLSTAISPQLSFWYSGYGSNIGEMHVDILYQGEWIKDIITPIIGNQNSAWINIIVDLTNYTGEVVVLKFRGITGGGFQGDMAFDDVSISEAAVVPVELMSFTAKAMDNRYIQLNWKTATEENNKGFQVTRSTNGIDFNEIAFVNGQGTTAELTSYILNDEKVSSGVVYYYQLKQTDENGAITNSHIVSASFNNGNIKTISEIYPNPANGYATLQIVTTFPEDFDITVHNQLGQMIEKYTHNTKENLFSMNTTNWTDGVYFITIKNNSTTITKRLIIQH